MNTIPPPPGILTDEEFQTIQAAGGPQAAPPEDRDFMAAQVNQYKAFRISAPRVEDIEARTASRNFLDKLTLDPDNIAAANNIDLIAKAPPDQQAAIRDRLVVDSWLTDRLRSHTVITPDGSTPAPELDPMRRDEWRDALSQELFGDNAPRGSDSALVAKLRERSDERRRHLRLLQGQDGADDEAKAVSNASLARWASRSAYAGESMVSGFAKWKEQARKSPNWTPTADKATLFEKWADVYGETKAKAAPYQAAVRQTLDALKAITKERDDFGTPEQFDAAVAPLLKLDEQTLRNIALPTLRSMAELDTEPGGTASFWDQMGKSFMRVFGQGAAAVGENSNVLARALTRRDLAQFTPPGMDTTQQQADVAKEQTQIQGENLVRSMLRNAITTDIDPIKPISTGPIGKRLEQMAYDVAGTAAYMTMLSVPYAGAAMATASFADDTTAMLLNKHPDMKASDARAIAAIAAPIQTGIEQLQRLQVFGRVPVFNQAMNRLAGPGGNALARFGLYGATGTLVEYTEEKLQDAAPLAVQALASALKQDIPQANLDGFEAFELRTFLAVAPFALIGAGVNLSQDKAAMRQLVSDEAAMRAVGFSEDGIQTIQAAETTEAQTQAIRQAWETRDTTAPANERWQETVRKAGEEAQAAALKQTADMARAAGVQQVRRAADGTTHVTLADGTVAVADNPLEAAAIIESATDAAQGWDNVLPLTQMMDALDARPDAPTKAIDAIIEERSNFADAVTRFTDIANDETVQEPERARAAAYLESLYTRAPIYEAEVARQAAAEGRNPEKIDWRKVTIAGQSAMEVREGVATAVIRIDKGASPYTVLEETGEADWAAMESAGMTVDGTAAEIRELERRVAAANPVRDENDKRPPDIYLTNYTGTNPKADRMAVIEAISRLVQVYATGTTTAKSRVAGVLREFRKTERAKLKQAEREGVAPRIMEYLKQKAEWLKLVISQAIRLNRARRAARDAGEEFPLERFLQRVAGVAVETQAAEEVTATAAEVWDDEGLTYIPPEGDDLTPFSFQPSEPTAEDARHAALEARAKAGDAEATAEAQAMVDAAAKAAGLVKGWNQGPRPIRNNVIETPFFYLTETPDPIWGDEGGPHDAWFIKLGDVLEVDLGSGAFINRKAEPEYFQNGQWTQLAKDDDVIEAYEMAVEEADDARMMGYDTISEPSEVRDGTRQYVALSPGQIKSADPFTYDEAENLIPLSKRFDSTRPEISFSFQPTGIFQMSETGPRAQPTIAPEAQATAKGLADKIDGMYESGQTEGVEDLEAQLEAMLDLMDSGSADLEQNAEETRDIDEFSPSPEEALVSAWISWNNPTVGYRPSEDNPTFGAYMRNLEGDASWVIRPDITDEQIEEAAQDAMAAYMRRREALTTTQEDQPLSLSFSFTPAEFLATYGMELPDGIQAAETDALAALQIPKVKGTSLAKSLEVPATRAKIFAAIDAALEWLKADPSKLATPEGWVEYLRRAGIHGEVMLPPTGIAELFADPAAYVAKLNGAYHGALTTPGTQKSAQEGLNSTRTMRDLIGTGKAPPVFVAALHHLWGILSRMLPPIHQEGLWLRLISNRPILDAIQTSIDGKFSLSPKQWKRLVKQARIATKGAGKIGNNATANANSFYLMLANLNGRWQDLANIYAAPSSKEMGRRFWALDAGKLGIKNKVQRFIGLTYGIPGVIMDRWKFVEFWLPSALQKTGAATPFDYFAYSNGTPEDPLGIYGVYGKIDSSNEALSLAMYEGLELALQAAIDASPELQAVLGDHANPGGLHWAGWNAIKNEAVGHSSLDFTADLIRNYGQDIDAEAVYQQGRAGAYYTEGADSSKTNAKLTLDHGKITLKRTVIPGGLQQRRPGILGPRTRAGNKGSGKTNRKTAQSLEGFSFQPTAILDDLANKVEARMSRGPQARLETRQTALDNLAALKLSFQRRRDGAGISDERSKASIDAEADVRQAFRAAELMQAAGISYATAREIVEGRRRAYEETLARETHARGVEDKTAQAIRREAATRQAFRRDELLQQVDEDYAQTLSAVYREFGFWDGPALNFLSKQEGGSRKGTLLSYSKAKRFAGKGAYVNPAVWDGSHELPRTLFAGTMQPDVAAQELFSAHPELFPAGTTSADVTPDMMWDAIGRELKDNKKMMEATKAYQAATRATADEAREYAEQWEAEYKAQLEAARMAAEAAASAYVSTATDGNEAAEKATAQAAKEAATWKRKATTMQNQDWNSKETLVRAMRTLDAILSAFPAAVRGKVGGWLALARIGTQDRMAEEIDRRITILDRELERELRKDALEELDALRERAKPKREAGKRPSGKLGAEAHRFFQRVEAVADLTADEVEAAGIALDTLATTATTPEEQADIYERQQILDQFGGLDSRDAAGVPLHDAQALAAALAAAETVYETGRNQWRTQEEARLAEVQAMAQEVTAAVGAAPLSRILAQGDAAKKLAGMLKGGTVSLRSFREVLHLIMGRDNPLAKQWADRAMDAMHARTDELADIRRRWRGAMEAATGQKRHKAEARVWDMGTKRTVAVTVRPGKPVEDVIPIDAIPNLAGLGYNAAEIADAEAAFLALPADSRAQNVTITRWQKDTEEAVSLTDAEAVYYSMLWRQEQYRENLNRAGLGQETQDEIEAGMSDAAKRLREYIAGEYAAGYYPLASLFRGMFGVDLPQIANYAPGKWWSRGVEKAMDPSGAGMVEGGFRTGMLKDRKAHLAEPKPENAFALWLGHVSQTAHWKAVAPLARELRGVFGHPEVKKAITARHGAETLDALTRWLDAIEANGVRTNFPAWAQTLLGWQANVKLAWKIGTILKQSTGLIGSAYRMPLKAYASGMRRLVTGQIDVADIWNSPMIQRRLESGFAPEVRAAMSRTFTDAPTLRRRFVQKGMELIGYVDAFFATASAAIHYDWQLSQIREAVPGISDAAAKRHAMRETQLVVNATAQPVEITERSLVEMGGFGKVFLIFGSEARQKSSMWLTAWSRVLRRQATEEDWRTLAIMHLIVGPMVQLISSAWMDARDDDDDEWFDEKNWAAWDFIRSAALGPMAGIPIIRDLTDGFSGDSGPTAQTAKAMQSAVRIVKGPEDSEDETVEWYAQRTAEILKGADSFTAVAAGIGEQAFRISDNLMDTREETQAKIDKLARKAKAAKDEDERQELLERIAGLREALK